MATGVALSDTDEATEAAAPRQVPRLLTLSARVFKLIQLHVHFLDSMAGWGERH